jgi:hypothetical protein
MAFIVPASKYRGPNATGFIVRSRDATGHQVWKTVSTLEEAKAERARAELAERQPRRQPVVSASITVADYFAEFLRVHGATLNRRTRALYQDLVSGRDNGLSHEVLGLGRWGGLLLRHGDGFLRAAIFSRRRGVVGPDG